MNEGLVRLWVPDVERRKGPGKRMPGFYNPIMKFARDMDVCTLAAMEQKPSKFLDALAGTGARGIRLMVEVPGMRGNVILNELSPRGFALVNLNLRENGISAEVHDEEFMSAVNIAPFDWIDIDPYGTPAPFLHPAVAAIKKGYLSVTATDTSVLSMTYPSVCRRRYGIHGTKTYMPHEIGLRGLLSYVVRTAASLDRGVRVLISYSADHYYRCIVELRTGAQRADGSLARLGHLSVGGHEIGPLYMGPLADMGLLARMMPQSQLDPRCAKLVSFLKEESALPPGYLHTDLLSRQAKVTPPTVERTIELLASHGFKASRTHVDPKGIRTDASEADAVRLLASR
jgi:tRNA (guanine26-N2/guanine27-N2)-dimethyltransferase